MLNNGARLHGRYTVQRLVGQGGMGAVYLCSDDRLGEASWALKELHHTPQEAHVLARLEHQNLPLVVDFFSESGRFYLVREYIPGNNLAEQVEHDGPLSEAVVLTWGLQIAEVLDFLHGQKPPILYRDLKPQNIVFGPQGLKLIDFGLAGGAKQDATAETVAGSLSYSAPEQLDDPNCASEASDIYGFGAILYFLLLARPPSPIEGRHRLLPSRPELLPETEELILRCLETDPRRRFNSANDLMLSIQFLQSRYPRLVAARGDDAAAVDEIRFTPVEAARDRGPWGRKVLSVLTLLAVLGGLGAFLIHSLPGVGGRLAPEQWSPEVNPVWSRLARDQDGLPSSNAADLTRLLEKYPDSGVGRILRSNASVGAGALHIPVLAPLSGEYTEFGEWMTRGVALYLEKPGARAPYIELYDTGSGAQVTLSVMEKLVKRTDIRATLGPMTSHIALYVAPLCNTQHVSMIAAAASDPRVLTAGPYLFGFCPTQTARYRKFVELLQQRGAKKILIAQPDAASLYYSVGDEFEEALRGLPADRRPVTSRMLYPGDLVFRAGFADQVFSRSFDGIFLTDNRPGPAARMISFFRRNGFKGPICCMAHVGSLEFLEGKDAVEGVLLVDFLAADRVPQLADFRKRYLATFHDEPRSSSTLAYCALTVLVAALDDRHADREEVRRRLDTLCQLGTAVGSDLDSALAYRVEGGRYVLNGP